MAISIAEWEFCFLSFLMAHGCVTEFLEILNINKKCCVALTLEIRNEGTKKK